MNLKCFSLIIASSWDRMSLTSDKSSEKNRIEESIFKSTLSHFCLVLKLAEKFSCVKLPKNQKKLCICTKRVSKLSNNGNFICVFGCTIVNLTTYRQFTNAA